MDDPGLKQFIAAMKARLYYSETNGGEYDAHNDSSDTGAWGKYQFIWGKPETKKGWGYEIMKYAKKKGYGDIDKYDFLKLGTLQEDFFDDVYGPKAYKWVKGKMDKNKRGLSIDEIAQLYHLSPAETEKYMSGGKWEPPGKQTPLDKYIKKGERGLNESGLPNLTTSIYDTKEDREKVVSDYQSELKRIQSSDMADGAKKMHIKSLKQKMYDRGYMDYINARNAERLEGFREDKKFFQEFYGQVSGNMTQKSSGGRPYQFVEFKDEKAKLMLDGLLEKHPELKKDVHKNSKGVYSFRLGMRGDKNNMEKWFMDSVNQYTGSSYTSPNDIVHDKKFGIEYKWLHKPGKLNLYDNKHDELVPLKFDAVDTLNDQIDPTLMDPRKVDLGQTDPVDVTQKTKETTVDPTAVAANDGQAAKVEEQDALDAFMENQVILDPPDKLHYDKSDFDVDLPFQAIANAFVGMAGLEASKEDMPLFTEQVSAGVMDYAAKMAKITEMGLPPEVEAKLRDDAASAYTGMMNNIVRASAGNRNLILGNQGQLDQNRMVANNQIAIADFQAKQDALEKYGEVMKYINEFDSRREINNTQVKQSMAMDRRKQGQDLAFAGFSAMNDSLADWNDNRPGSGNHMIMSAIRQKTFGWDPEIRDDGSGTKKGTRSYYERTVSDPLKANNDAVKYLQENENLLDDGERKFMNLVSSRTGNQEEVARAMKFIRDNDPQRVMSADGDRLNEAISSGDFNNLLFEDVNQSKYLSDQDQSMYERRNMI